MSRRLRTLLISVIVLFTVAAVTVLLTTNPNVPPASTDIDAAGAVILPKLREIESRRYATEVQTPSASISPNPWQLTREAAQDLQDFEVRGQSLEATENRAHVDSSTITLSDSTFIGSKKGHPVVRFTFRYDRHLADEEDPNFLWEEILDIDATLDPEHRLITKLLVKDDSYYESTHSRG